MDYQQLTEMLEQKGIFYDFMNLIWRSPFGVILSSSEFIRVDLEESELNYIEVRGENHSAYIIIYSRYEKANYFWLMLRWAELCGNPDFPFVQMRLSEDFTYSLRGMSYVPTEKENGGRIDISLKELPQLFGDIQLTDVILHDKSSVKLHPRLSDNQMFDIKYGSVAQNLNFFKEEYLHGFMKGAFQCDYTLMRLDGDFRQEYTGGAIGVIEARMTDNPYQLRVVTQEYKRKLRDSGITCDPFYVIRFADRKPHTYENIASVSCIIVCFGTLKRHEKKAKNAISLTDEQLRAETEKLAGLFPASRWFLSDDPEKTIKEIETHPLMNPARNCLYIC